MLFKRTHKRPIPEGATITRTRSGRVAKWTDSKGRKQSAPVSLDGGHILVEAATWTARYRDASGRLVQRPTGCERLELAQSLLSDWLALEEKQRAGIVTASEAGAAEWAHVAIADHVTDFEDFMRAKGLHTNTVKTRAYYLNRIFTATKTTRLPDISRSKVERWLHDQVGAGMGLRTANAHIAALSAFCGWALREGRIMNNQAQGMAKFNEATDRRRPRRDFTLEELGRLFNAAQERPLHDLRHKATRAKDKSEAKAATLTPATIDAAQWLGRVRSMAYKTLAYTGLRYGELRSITLGQTHLNHTPAYLELKPEHEKSRRGAQLPLPAFLAAELKEYTNERLKRLSGDCSAFPGAFRDKVLFDLPKSITRAFNADLEHAGLATSTKYKTAAGYTVKAYAKTDQAGRSLDVHCLRHSFISMLALSGASMVETAKAARHTDPRLTLKVYSHVDLEALGAALEGMPEPGSICEAEQVANEGENSLSLETSLATGKTLHFESLNGTFTGIKRGGKNTRKPAKTPINTGKNEWRAQQDSNLWPLAPEASALSN